MKKERSPKEKLKLGLCLGALGVVFGDVGTSPLYTMKECMVALGDRNEAGVLGVLSLIFWTLVLVVCWKYVSFILKADRKGEGGIFSLLSLTGLGEHRMSRGGIGGSILIILAGAALLFGESMITPAITVLSAAEGLKGFGSWITQTHVIVFAVGILMVLFSVQKKGTETMGRLFGPVMLVWFFLLACLGVWHICHEPTVLRALNPYYAWELLIHGIPASALTMLLGSVVLAITGVEALYADLGHFGRRAISIAWYGVVMPGLVLNYFGQGAYVLNHVGVSNPFFELVPLGWPQGSLSILSIVAAVIASQAVISGAYSITQSAIQLGYFPRLKIQHTNADVHGQIYVPFINFILAVAAITIVLTFKSSENLAAAYGVAVTGTMVVTTYAFYFAAVHSWHWAKWKALGLCALFWFVDMSLFISTLHKFWDGGWLPVLIGLWLFLIMHTWKSGRMAVRDAIFSSALTEMSPSEVTQGKSVIRVPGCAVFMAASSKGLPVVMAHHLKANKCLQETTVILTFSTPDDPYVDDKKRLLVENLGAGLWRVIAQYGYMENPSVIKVFKKLVAEGLPLRAEATTFYFNREVIIPSGASNLFGWQVHFYSFLSRNALTVKDYYSILPTQIIEVGLPVRL